MPNAFRMTQAHLEAFSGQQRQRFEDEMVAYLQEQFPVEFTKMGEAWMHELIGEGIKTAEGHNIVLECDVARYIGLMLAIAPDFDESETTHWTREILTRRRLTGEQKLDQIEDRWAMLSQMQIKEPAP